MADTLKDQMVKSYEDDLARIEETMGNELIANPKVPVTVFKQYFVPLFNGETDDETGEGLAVKVMQLSNGSLTVPIDIVDNDGNVVDTLPPIIDREVFTGVNFNSIAETAELKDNHLPGAGEAYLANALTPTVQKIQNNDGWKEIISKYSNGDIVRDANETLISEDEELDLNYD